jgi:hypothetical protein
LLPVVGRPASGLVLGGAAWGRSCVDEPGDTLDELVRDVEHGRVRNQQGPSVAGVMSEITMPVTRGPVLSPPPTRSFPL